VLGSGSLDGLGEGLSEGVVVGLGEGDPVGLGVVVGEAVPVGEGEGVSDTCANTGGRTKQIHSSAKTVSATSFPPRTPPVSWGLVASL
jgi:hypothetical protein